MRLLGWPFDREPLRHGVVHGIAWAICPGPSPHHPDVNGYAQIPAEGHPWSCLEDYDDIDGMVSAPGGLTYGPVRYRFLPGSKPVTMTDVGGWIGFDTGHAFDIWTDEALAEGGLVREPIPGYGYFDLPHMPTDYDRQWTVDRVEHEAKELARQIAAVGNPDVLAHLLTHQETQ